MTHPVRSHGFTALGPLHEAFARLTGWPAVITSLLLGAFSAVAFAPFHFSVVLVISFTGLIWMLDGAPFTVTAGTIQHPDQTGE